ncbi:UNVERIFIED_CONTAM: hypothetical protein K2H54_049090 [Gekko kuhli]
MLGWLLTPVPADALASPGAVEVLARPVEPTMGMLGLPVATHTYALAHTAAAALPALSCPEAVVMQRLARVAAHWAKVPGMVSRMKEGERRTSEAAALTCLPPAQYLAPPKTQPCVTLVLVEFAPLPAQTSRQVRGMPRTLERCEGGLSTREEWHMVKL